MFQMKTQLHNQKKETGMKGFTLIEVLIVMFIFSIGILAVAAMQMTATRGNASARRITEATTLAENRMENLMRLSYDHADLDPENNPHVSIQGPYTVNWNVAEIDLDADAANDSKTVNVIVSWRYGKDCHVSLQYVRPEY